MESLRRRNAAPGRLSYGERASYIEPDMTSLGFIKLEIPTAVPEPPIGEGWIHEIKYDGYRTLIVTWLGRIAVVAMASFCSEPSSPGILLSLYAVSRRRKSMTASLPLPISVLTGRLPSYLDSSEITRTRSEGQLPSSGPGPMPGC